jgi:hypothetical protein
MEPQASMEQVQQQYPIYHLEELPGKSESDSLPREVNSSMKRVNPLKQFYPPANNLPDSQPNSLMPIRSQTKKQKPDLEEIPVCECQCVSCQEMKDKPINRNYGPQLSQYMDMFPVELKNRSVV